MLAITYSKITKIKVAEWGTPKKCFFLKLDIIHQSYHGEIDIAGVELQVDMLVHQGLRLCMVVMANGARRLIKEKRY